MLFAADIGNSCIDIGLFDEAGNLKMKSKISSVGSRTVDEYTVVISGLLAANGFLPDAITDGIVSSVVPGLTAVIKSAVKKLSDISFVEVGPGTKNGLKIRIDVQTQLGTDIVANAVAATSEYRTPVIIIDVGTVTTITAVDADGVLEGVIISPGLKVSLDAMADAASGLNGVSLLKPKRFIGKNTAESVCSGVMYGHVFMIEGFVSEIRRMQGYANARVVMTGGLAETVRPLCTSRIDYDPDLVLKGLFLIHRKNQK